MLMIAFLGIIHLVAGYQITRHVWRPRRLSDVPAAWVLTSLTSFYGGPILLGEITGWINRWTVALAAVLTLGLVYIARRRHPEPAFSLADLRGGVRRMSRGELTQWVLIACLLLGSLAIGSILPIRKADAAEYHAINPMRWAQTHRFDLRSYGGPELNPHIIAGEVFPNVKAVLPFLILEYTGKEDGTAMAQWPFLVLLTAALFGFYKRLGVPGWAAAAGVLFSLLAPEVLLQSLEAYADLAFVAGQIAIAWILLAIWQDGPTRRNVRVAALSFAFLVGSKPTSLFMAAMLGAALLGFVLYKSQASTRGRRVLNALGAFVTVFSACFILAGPWYLRGLTEYANPVYPIEVKFGDTVVFPGVYDQNVGTVYAQSAQGTSGRWAWLMIMNEGYRLPLLASYFGGLGAHALILGFPAFLLFLAAGWQGGRWKKYYPVAWLFFLMYYASPVKVWPRLILFELALYGFVFVWLLTEVPRWVRIVLLSVFFVLGGYNLLRTIPAVLYRTRPPELVAFPALTGHRRHVQMDTFPDEFTALDYWRLHLGRDGHVLALPDLWSWYARPLNRNASVVRVPRLEENRNVNAWADSLLELGATHLYTQRKIPEFAAALDHPERFRPLFRRLDSGAESPWFIQPSDEAAIFEILRREEAGP